MPHANGRIHRFRCRVKSSWIRPARFGKNSSCQSCSLENRGSDTSLVTGLTKNEKRRNSHWRESITRSEKGRKRTDGNCDSVLSLCRQKTLERKKGVSSQWNVPVLRLDLSSCDSMA